MTARASRPRRSQRRGLRVVLGRPASVIVCVLLLIPLLVIGAPHLAAEICLLPARPVLTGLRDGESPDLAALKRAEGALSRALDFTPADGRAHTDLGLVLIVQAERLGLATPEGRNLASKAAQALERGLSREPANPYAWVRLANARFAQGQSHAASTRRALAMSYVTGRYAYRVMPQRIEIAMQLYEELAPELRQDVARDIAALWNRSWEDQKRVFRLACRYDRSFLVAQALGADKKARAEFDKLYPDYLSPEGCAAHPA